MLYINVYLLLSFRTIPDKVAVILNGDVQIRSPIQMFSTAGTVMLAFKVAIRLFGIAS